VDHQPRHPAGRHLFLRLIFMLVIPLLFSALVVGVAEMGDVRALGRIGWKTLAYTVVVSGIAVLIGLVLVNWLRPGAGIDPATAQQMLAAGSSAPRPSSAALPSSPAA
jgi:DAACS family dicarboxylate/amino acid:cation (Na+ or H+) symporter